MADIFSIPGAIFFGRGGFEAVPGSMAMSAKPGADWDAIGRGEPIGGGEPLDPELRKVMRRGLDKTPIDDDDDLSASMEPSDDDGDLDPELRRVMRAGLDR